ncbi:MAG: hypothetical protein LUD81_06755 [Clostridiales bacterium]|nr:hypothetical protein [Clostridiales bacterium]
MLKKLMLYVTLFVFLLSCGVLPVSAEEYAENEQPEAEEVINCVTRHDCLVGIMKAAGLQADGYFESGYIIMEKLFFDDPLYDREYLYFADITGVVLGEENEKASTWLSYYPNETATARDCVGFIMRVIDSVAKDKTDDELFERAKLRGLVKSEDSFYINPDETLSYDNYYTLICRMLNEKRYLYLEFNDNMDPITWVNSYHNFVKYDKSGEMTYIDYLTPFCKTVNDTDENSISAQVIKELNIVNISKLNCLMAVTKAGGMRVEGLFEASDVCVSVMKAAGLSEEWLKYVEAYVFKSRDMPDYGRETTVFSMIYGILPDENEGEKTYFSYDNKIINMFCDRASVKDCVYYMLWFLTDMPDNITSEEVYALALETGLVEESDNAYENWEKPIDYSYFRNLLNRMFNMKRYIYFEEENESSWFNAKNCDESREMTYSDYFKEIYN